MAISDGLERMNKMLEMLGNPEKDFRVIHIAGTNGKGSTAYMIASILEQAGYSLGLYTSPHLIDICERIQIWSNENHEMIDSNDYKRFEDKVNAAHSKITELGDLHYFERVTAIAYLYFAEKKPDYVILECGLGGRLDSTNTIERPLVSVITQIGLDHTAELGETIYEIAKEKAGIIKPNVPIVSQTSDAVAKKIFKDRASELGSKFVDAIELRSEFEEYELGMKGIHQIDNAATAVAAIKTAEISVSDEAIEKGLAKAVNPGRFEILAENPYLIIDGAHNNDAIKASILTIQNFIKINKIKKYIIVLGCMQDKDYSMMIRTLCTELRGCDFATVGIDDIRSADPHTLGECFVNNDRNCTVYDEVDDSIRELSEQNYETVIYLGSIYLAGAVKQIIKKRKG